MLLALNPLVADFATNGLRLVEITLDKWANGILTAGDYIGIRNGARVFH